MVEAVTVISLMAHGFPTVTLSVGYEEIHIKNERMPVEELNKLADLLLEIVHVTANK